MNAAENEQQVIGSVLLDPPLIGKLVARLRPTDFADLHHRDAYAAMLAIEARGDPLSELSVARELRESCVFSRGAVRPAVYVGETAERTPTSAHWDYHARHVLEASQKRRLRMLSDSIIAASENNKPSREVLSDLMAECDDLRRDFASADPDAADGFITAHEVVTHFIDDLEAGLGEMQETGIERLDYALSGGLCFGEMTILGGRPSHGKTMLALQILDGICGRGHECLLLSEEMGQSMLARRFLNRTTDIGQDRWRERTVELREAEEQWKATRLRFHIVPPCGTIKQAVQVIDNAARRDIRVVAVDYAQLLRGKGSNKYETTSDVSQQLREATSRHDLLMLCVCQLSRKSEDHEGTARISDIRDSGQFEQDADVILFVDWPALRGAKVPGDEYWVRIRKNRNRDTLTQDVQLIVDRRRQSISSPSYEWNP